MAKIHYAYGVWKQCRMKTIRKLREIAEDLHLHHQNINIATITGHSTSMLAAALGVAGFAASFFTAGTSLILLAVSAGIGAGGGMTVAGSSITHSLISQSAQAEANEILEEDHCALQKLLVLFEALNHTSREEIPQIRQRFEEHVISEESIILSTSVEVGKIGLFVGNKLFYNTVVTADKLANLSARAVATSGGEDALTLVLRAVGVQVPRNVIDSVGSLVSLAFLPLDIWGVIKAAAVVTGDSETETTELLNHTADALEREILSEEEFDILIDTYLSSLLDN